MIDPQIIKKDFPIFQTQKTLVYLDNAATTHKPRTVIEAISNHYSNNNSNVHRGLYNLSIKATEDYENARTTVQKFLNAKNPEEIIFTRNATESLNLLAHTLKHQLEPQDEIILSIAEHHSNIVPWQIIAKEKNLKIKFVDLNKDFQIDVNDLKEKISDKTKIISINHISNTLGVINPIKEIIKIAKEKNILTIIDACQSVPHLETNVKELDCDFLVFSGHKVFGPSGVGVIYGKKQLLENLPPFLTGGEMISSVTINESKWNSLPHKFEAGTPNIEGAIGLAEALKYIKKIGFENIIQHDKKLTNYTLEKLKEIPNLEIIGPSAIENRIGNIAFTVKGIHPHDLAEILNSQNICIRAGNHCTQPLHDHLQLNATARISLQIYNSESDIDKAVDSIKKAIKIFE